MTIYIEATDDIDIPILPVDHRFAHSLDHVRDQDLEENHIVIILVVRSVTVSDHQN